MTLLCCWFDQSYSRERITAIADAQASYKDASGHWQVLTETTTKLLPVTVKCHRLSDFDPATSRLAKPYHTTEIAVGYAGYCFEALSIIELLRRCCGQLLTPSSEALVAAGDGLVNLLATLTDQYFACHSRPEQQVVEMVMFGFSPEAKPWIATLKHTHGTRTAVDYRSSMDAEELFVIGDAKSMQAISALPALREQISRHKRKSSARLEAGLTRDLDEARHEAADKKVIEAAALDVVENAFMTTVGGVLQKLELYSVAGDEAVAAYSQNREEHMLEGLPQVSKDLGYAPLTEHMGR